MTAGSQQSKDKSFEKDLGQGIVSSHAYAILDTQVVIRDGEERIIQMRNPWGTGEWKGDWSDKSSKWTPELKQRLNFQEKDDGIFWIKIEDFCKQFSEVTVSKLHKDYIYTFHKVKMLSNAQYVCIPLTVHKNSTKAFLEITQPDKRNYSKLDEPYEYSMMQIFVTSENFTQFLTSEKTYCKSVHKGLKLDKGRYIIYVEIDWYLKKKADVDSIVVSAYSNYKVDFDTDNITYPDATIASGIVDRILLHKRGEVI